MPGFTGETSAVCNQKSCAMIDWTQSGFRSSGYFPLRAHAVHIMLHFFFAPVIRPETVILVPFHLNVTGRNTVRSFVRSSSVPVEPNQFSPEHAGKSWRSLLTLALTSSTQTSPPSHPMISGPLFFYGGFFFWCYCFPFEMSL